LGRQAAIAEAAVMSVRRAGFIAELAWPRLVAGQTDDAASLKLVYLREAVVTPPRGGGRK